MKFKSVVPVVAAGFALGLGVVACGGEDEPEGNATATATQAASTEDQAAQNADVKIAFSAPAADHGWLKALSDNAKAKAKELGLDMTVNDSATTSAEQADQIETLIQEKPDVLVVLPNEGEPLTPVAQKAMDQGIQVINIDREFSNASAYHTIIGGDNYGIGVQAGNFFADQLQCKGNVVEIQGVAGISVTEQRSQGFADQLKKRCNDGIKIVAKQPADFVPDKGLSVMENILQGQKQIDAVYTHDDDMGEGVASAIENAGRADEMWMTGAGGSKAVMERIKEGGLWKATFLYNPAMSADAVYLASLLGQKKGLPGFAAPEIPSRITLAATTVTQENVDQYMNLGF
ncbi:monosaccharide ABC transporter substrate-binding protein (CUT2 family) [Solirubrobacter pauli]|uniref:Monosaccharide ABC transporter substrate-binding protein (CUT2 family) n=1 Tax=Solirubrobacter pauli TaxID=166793 RepID=A0A660L4D1_9ACTN|nr:substrate-binding domain-containing protein [Solirubrobacter pauli]RKQ88268.1 monosaccharide ABC transporter substrate-binding protein (CUT2 family) [Solirubrobacter pauli]